MSPNLHLLMPMSGQGTRYQLAGYTEPKPLIPVSGVPMVERLLSGFPSHWPAHFVMAENHRDTPLPALLGKLRPDGKQLFIPPHKFGPSYAILKALGQVPADAPVLVSYCDYGMLFDAAAFERFVRSSECDFCLISYRGFHAHYLSPTTYAYARLHGERVVEVREKGSFTADREDEYASTGGYYFRTAALLQKAIEYQIESDLQLNGEFYTSLTVEALLRCEPQAHGRVFEIPGFFQWGTPADLRNFEFWERSYSAYNRVAGRTGEVAQVLMPMAGLGSRFAPFTSTPKPLIPVGGRPMFRAALDSQPRAQRTVLVALQSMVADLTPHLGTDAAAPRVVALPKTPPGQALSTEAGLAALDPEQEVLVTACDHGIVLAAATWEAFRSAPDCDAAIFTMRGFYGAARRPLAYSYVVPQPTAERFPLVERVAVKEAVSSHPEHDAVLVGTFWFRSAALLQAGIAALEAADERTNGELYLDSVFKYLAATGAKVRMIPLEGFLCWGEPESLAEALYWQEIFTGRSLYRRPRLPGVG